MKDVDHFLIGYTALGKEQKTLMEELRVEGAGEWLEEFERVGTEGKVALLLGKEVKRMGKEVMVEVGRCNMCWIVSDRESGGKEGLEPLHFG